MKCLFLFMTVFMVLGCGAAKLNKKAIAIDTACATVDTLGCFDDDAIQSLFNGLNAGNCKQRLSDLDVSIVIDKDILKQYKDSKCYDSAKNIVKLVKKAI